MVAVPKSQQVHGPRIDHLLAQAPPEAWQRLSAGPGAKGERFYDWAAARLRAVGECDGDEPDPRYALVRREILAPDTVTGEMALPYPLQELLALRLISALRTAELQMPAATDTGAA